MLAPLTRRCGAKEPSWVLPVALGGVWTHRLGSVTHSVDGRLGREVFEPVVAHLDSQHCSEATKLSYQIRLVVREMEELDIGGVSSFPPCFKMVEHSLQAEDAGVSWRVVINESPEALCGVCDNGRHRRRSVGGIDALGHRYVRIQLW